MSADCRCPSRRRRHIVGFGAAGACAALEAAVASCSVPSCSDRFTGPTGPPALSGGVVYARARHAAAARRQASATRPEAILFGYLRPRWCNMAPAGTLREFCNGSVADAGVAGEPRRAVRGQPLPGQDVLIRTNRRYLLLLGQRAVRPGHRAARAPGPPGPRPRHIGRAPVRAAGRSGRGMPALQSRFRLGRCGALHRGRAGDQGQSAASLRGAPWWAGTAHRLLYWAVRNLLPRTCRSSAGSCTRPFDWLERRFRANAAGQEAARGVRDRRRRL